MVVAKHFTQGSSPEFGVPDMTVISDIDETGINRNLQVRYERDQIYTYTGSILVAVNPYKEVDYYTNEYVSRYHGRKMGALEPHVFALAEAAYRSLQDTESNQSCVISGESGAGKTETTKFILQYLCSVTSNVDTWVEQQILEANTILEAFGNAKTVRNDNSSRFGKFMQVCFDSKWMIKGCIIQDYLLEQSRITFQSPGERNYHVLYQLVEAGTRDKEFAEQFKLKPAIHYKYLNQSGCVKIGGISDSRKLDALRLAFNVLQVAPEMCEGIFRVLSAILWLGNLNFEDVDGERCELTEEDEEIIETVAPLLGLQVEDLRKVVLIRQINVRGNITEIPLKVQEAKENRHAMAKALYSRTFAWLINHINNCTNPGQDSSRFLGVLDIFGFENFSLNSFEQLCINYTNEKLHKFFNHYVFALEQELYHQEEIQYSHITFTDNTMCLELIEKPPRCVLKLLTEQCHMPKGSDLAYLTNLHAEFDNHPCYVKGDDRRRWEKEFGVRHYAGCVTYTVEGFVEKNRDVQQDVFFDFMSRSTSEFVQEITVYQDLLGCTVLRATGNAATTMSRGTSKGKPTLCDSFRHQLQALVDVLQATTPWYARCIKPNMEKVSNHYDEKLVLDQLKYLGMLDIIRIRKEGFPIHMGFHDFVSRYRCLDRGRNMLSRDDREAVRSLISSQGIPETEWQIGKTKVFLRSYVHEPLEDCRNQMVSSNALMIQKIWRGYTVRKEYKKIREAALKVQHAYRGWKLRIIFIRKRRAAIIIQSHLRGVFAREVAAALREMRRVDEEMRKRERLEEERRLMEDKKALEESQRKAQEEIATLTQMAEQMNSKIAASDLQSVDLDNLFSFLSDVQSTKSNQIIEEIGEQMDNLVEDLDVELETVIKQELEMNSKVESKMNTTPNGQEVTPVQQAQRIGGSTGKLGQPSLPEPTEPPPPPPPPIPPLALNGDSSADNGEPIYESVLPREESGPSSPIMINGSPGTMNGDSCGFPPPVPVSKVKEPLASSPPPRPESQNSNGHHLHHNHHHHPTQISQPQQNGHDQQQQQPIQPQQQPQQQQQQLQQQQAQVPQQPIEREQRRKCRVERKLQELEDKREQDIEQATYHDIVEFAQNYFNSHERSPEGTIMATLTRKSRGKSVEFIPKYEMVTYYKGSSIPNSHIHMYDPDNVNVACSVFRDLCKYIRGEMKLDVEIATIQSIIGYGIEREELRDEIFVQCMRQATNNPNPEWAERVWLLLCLAIVAFQPSKLLYKYFVSFLRKNLVLEGKLRQYVQWCIDNCKNTKVSCRQYPPSTVEIAAMRRLGTIVCRFFFLDGRTKAIDVHPTDTAADAVAKLADKLGLRSLEGWAIYQSRPDGEEHVRAHDYLYDVIAAWEMKQCKLNTSQSTFSTLRRGNNATLGSGDNRFVFKRRLFRNTREISQDPVEVNMLYAQAVYNVVKCDDFPVSEKVALQLAGLQAQVALGDPKDNDRLDYYSEVDSFLPYRISRARGDDVWVPIIAQAHRQYGAGRKELAAKVLYLSCVMQYPLYGTTMFNVTYRGYWSYGNQLILGINCDGLMLIKPDDKFVLSEYRYQDVESIMLDPSDSFITISLLRHNPDSSHKCFVFETAQKNEIGSLIVSYCPALAGWITENEVPAKKFKGITNEDRIRLYHNLVNCRRTLVDAEILRKPQDSGGGFLRNTLRRLSKHRIEKLRQEHGSATDHGETYKGFPYAYWAFSRQPIPQTLSKLPDPEDQMALSVFQLILTYAGLGQNGDTVRRVEDEHVNLIQTVMERCIRKETLLGELYLQLIKQTTDHPDPNSRVNLRHWALLSLACSVILPPQKLIRKYLIAHLKRCASDYVTEEGKYARFAEKCLYKTQGTRRRQWPPSREEIMCTINRRPIYARFHFMDGQYHAVEFHPSATATDVMEIIKAKIGLEETAMGYAIYEVLGPTERALVPDEKIADVMSKWERYRSASASQQGQQPQRKHAHHFFLFKKHLFLDQYMNLDDPVEKELLYHQVLHDLRADRFPITEKEAMMLTALQAQLELGDCHDGLAEQEYRTISSHCLPSRLVPTVCIEGVLQHHQSLRGMTPPEAKKAFLNLIQSWPLHRATIFDVMQSFTSNWPRVLWLAVDQLGLHLLEHRSRNTLCTYEYSSILSYNPAISSLMIITCTDKKQSKVILTTSQAHQIANLIKEYMEVLQSPPEIPKRDSVITQSIAQQYQQATTTLPGNAAGRKSRPASMLHRGAPVIQSQAS
ncbi:PREDICTED: unconventional myosin-X isoform X2 [Polistes dominula]|uniref:Unconventional myosin-X isoform X2 n=1 Tax=Polistes dominula TaxID=743375 RepID=A0ABM1IXQ0_POLDO|nr:PREDICTED: unconventional myosin-X isoform X2 [Polistes dominula]